MTSVLSLRYAAEKLFLFVLFLVSNGLRMRIVPFSQSKIDWISSELLSDLSSLSREDLGKIC